MAILTENTLEFNSSSVEQTVRLGVRLGELLQTGDVLCLDGELGAGKTVLARGISRGWGTVLRVTSPSFTLVNEYPRPRDGRILYHFDCYRLSGPAEAMVAGIHDLLDRPGVFMIEWPERIASLLPADRLWIGLSYINETRRALRIEAEGERSIAILKSFRQSAFGV